MFIKFLLFAILIFYLLLGYEHPKNGHPIKDLRYTTIEITQPIIKRFKAKNPVIELSAGKRRLFISYSYETGPYPPGHKPGKERHLPVLCPFQHEEIPCGVCGFKRNYNILYHNCLVNQSEKRQMTTWLDKLRSRAPQVILPQSPRRKADTTLNQQQLEVLHSLIVMSACTPLSLGFLSSDHFRTFMESLVSIGQKNPLTHITQLIPTISPDSLSYHIKQTSTIFLSHLLATYQDQLTSIMFDAATINHKKYLGITITNINEPQSTTFFQLTEAPSTRADYKSFLLELMRTLTYYRITVASICTDGMPAQVSGINDALTEIQSSPGDYVGNAICLPIHVPCLNHRVNLVLVHSIDKTNLLSKIKNIIQNFSDSAADNQHQMILHKHCPTFIHTRWLSLSLICAYIRLKRSTILGQGYMTLVDITNTIKLELLLLPLIEMHLLFEREEAKLYQAWPIIIRGLLQYQRLLRHPLFQEPDWFSAIITIIWNIYTFLLSGDLGNRLALAFSLTPVGRLLYRHHRFVSGYSPVYSIPEVLRTMFVNSFSVIIFLFSGTIRVVFIIQRYCKTFAHLNR